jgi:hypothetical protein
MFVVGLLVMLMWFFGLVFLILTILFRKRKIPRWFFGGLTVVFIITPFIFLKYLEWQALKEKENYIGEYHDNQTGSFLTLNGDYTWKADSTLFDCSSGEWNYESMDGDEYVSLWGNCDVEMNHCIFHCSPDSLTITTDQKDRTYESVVVLTRRH